MLCNSIGMSAIKLATLPIIQRDSLGDSGGSQHGLLLTGPIFAHPIYRVNGNSSLHKTEEQRKFADVAAAPDGGGVPVRGSLVLWGGQIILRLRATPSTLRGYRDSAAKPSFRVGRVFPHGSSGNSFPIDVIECFIAPTGNRRLSSCCC